MGFGSSISLSSYLECGCVYSITPGNIYGRKEERKKGREEERGGWKERGDRQKKEKQIKKPKQQEKRGQKDAEHKG